MADIPVYLIAGFLDGGKTEFINGILEDGFAREDKTLLICCEEGELEYEQKALDNVTVVTVDEESALTCSQCKEWEKHGFFIGFSDFCDIFTVFYFFGKNLTIHPCFLKIV